MGDLRCNPPASDAAPRDAPRLAPRWHTAALVALIASVATAGLVLTHVGRLAESAQPATPSPSAYLLVVVVQASLALYVVFVARDRGALGALLGPTWPRARAGAALRAGVDLAIALALVAAVEILGVAFTRAAGVSVRTGAAALLPRTPSELVAWAAVAISVGVCEEIVYRGYLQQHLAAWLRSDVAAIVLQAALFGLAHADQGLRGVEAGIDGLLFGVVVHQRRSLLPAIVAHVAVDLLSAAGHLR